MLKFDVQNEIAFKNVIEINNLIGIRTSRKNKVDASASGQIVTFVDNFISYFPLASLVENIEKMFPQAPLSPPTLASNFPVRSYD